MAQRAVLDEAASAPAETYLAEADTRNALLNKTACGRLWSDLNQRAIDPVQTKWVKVKRLFESMEGDSASLEVLLIRRLSEAATGRRILLAPIVTSN